MQGCSQFAAEQWNQISQLLQRHFFVSFCQYFHVDAEGKSLVSKDGCHSGFAGFVDGEGPQCLGTGIFLKIGCILCLHDCGVSLPLHLGWCESDRSRNTSPSCSALETTDNRFDLQDRNSAPDSKRQSFKDGVAWDWLEWDSLALCLKACWFCCEKINRHWTLLKVRHTFWMTICCKALCRQCAKTWCLQLRREKNNQSNWTTLFSILLKDPDVCKYHLVGDCPHEMWVNQAMPLVLDHHCQHFLRNETYSVRQNQTRHDGLEGLGTGLHGAHRGHPFSLGIPWGSHGGAMAAAEGGKASPNSPVGPCKKQHSEAKFVSVTGKLVPSDGSCWSHPGPPNS